MDSLHPLPARRDEPGEFDARRRSDSILAILDEVATLDAKLIAERSAEARRVLADRRDALAVTLLHTLQAWRRRGGVVRCDLHSARAAVVGSAGPDLADGGRALLRDVLDGVEIAEEDTEELERLHAGIRTCLRWNGLSRELRRGVVALFTTRLRRLQDDHGVQSPRLEEAFAMLTAYSKREQPGFVVGLSRAHRPVHGTWDADARVWWDRLETFGDYAAPHTDSLVSEVERLVPAVEVGGAGAHQLVSAVRVALDGGVPGWDPRLARACAPVVDLLDPEEFRTLVRAIEDLVPRARAATG